jgi:putative hydrolase of the HAD superfamily
VPPIYAAITFDFWNTLVVARVEDMRDRRADAWLGLLEGAGFAHDRQNIERAMESAFEAYQVAWEANEQFSAVDAVDHALGELGLAAPPDLREELIGTLVHGDVHAELTPNAARTLRVLKDAGMRLGIICDVGFSPSPRLRAHLEHHGVLELFDHWSFSDEVGYYKPSAEIFRHALTGLGVEDPSAVAHVGDLRRTDIAGARAFGVTAVRYAGIFDDPSDGEEGHHVITDHAELPAVLGIARR